MSYWVYLENADGDLVEVGSHQEGGTTVLGGTTRAELNVTYNYTVHIMTALHEDGLRYLNGRRADDTIIPLETAVISLGGPDRDHNYWASTPGNAAHALSLLLSWAKEHPAAVWRVS